MTKDSKKQRIPTITADQLADAAVERINKDKKYAIAKDTSKKFGLITAVLAKQSAKIKQLEKVVMAKDNKPAAVQDNTLQALTSSMSTIAMSMQNLAKALSTALSTKSTPTGSTSMPAPQLAVSATGTPVAQKEESSFSLLKSFFTNPVVVAAMAGIVYTVLPKEMQDNVKALLGGFADGVGEVMGKNEEEGFSGVNAFLKNAGIALATYFGVKAVGSTISAITTTLKILKILGGGKAVRGLAVAAGAVGVGVAANVAMSGKKNKEDEQPSSGGGTGGSIQEGAGSPSSTGGKVDPGQPAGKDEGPAITKVQEIGKGYNVVQLADGSVVRRAGNANWRNNNPGNIVDGEYARKHGALPLPANAKELGQSGRFAVFPTYEAGRRAKANLLFTGKGYKDLSVSQAIARWAPESDNNDVKLYQSRVLAALGGQDPIIGQLNSEQQTAVLNAMEKMEGYKKGNIAVVSPGTGGAPATAYASTSPAAEPVKVATAGSAINTTSQNVKALQKPDNGVDVANIENTNTSGNAKKKGPTLMASIPSPIASRGSLGVGTRHASAYS